MGVEFMPSLRKFLFTGLFLALVGWAGLGWLFTSTLPTLGPRWLMFFFIMLALTGTVLPFVAFFNRRFPSDPPVDVNIVLRQAMWVGIYGNILVWLQLGRVLNLVLSTFLAVGFVLIEFLIRLRERSRFRPKEESPE
jgi:hypothetical protein